MSLTKDDFLVWLENPCTEAFRKDLKDEIDKIIADLIASAGRSQLNDTYKRGAIDGLKWLVEWQPTVEQEEEDTDDDGTDS
jgi:hypothetical protein